MTQERLTKLLAKKARIERQLKALEMQKRKQKRREDTRRKIIAGALALEHAQLDTDFAAILGKLLNRYVTRPEDRALFGLPERKPQKPANDFAEVAQIETA